MSHLHAAAPADEIAWEAVPAERVEAGAPLTRAWVQYDNPAERLSAGIWEATVGKWRVAYEEWEQVVVLTGECVITGDDGAVLRAGPGDAFAIEPGFTGTWEVTVPMRKRWVVRV